MNFESITSEIAGSLPIWSTLICMVVAVVLGVVIALTHTINKRYSKNFIITLAVLPLLVEVVIMLVNGNLGTSVAILGSFTLIRFRSMPGTSRELLSVFLAMAIGLTLGMGHVYYAIVFTVFASIVILILDKINFGGKKGRIRKLTITIPENLDYTTIFDEVFETFAKNIELDNVRTTNLGSMYKLTYTVTLYEDKNEKEFIDELRIRNGNLDIILGREELGNEL